MGRQTEEVDRRDLFETGNRVRELRMAANLTQEQLAEKMDVAGNTISRIETGATVMGIDKLFRLCEELHATPDMFCPERFYKNSETSLAESVAALMRLEPFPFSRTQKCSKILNACDSFRIFEHFCVRESGKGSSDKRNYLRRHDRRHAFITLVFPRNCIAIPVFLDSVSGNPQ